MSEAVLQTRNLHKAFGALVVANQINFALEPGARHAIIGPNGAGKTTFVNLIAGVLKPDSGHVLLGGTDITALAQAERVKRGIARTFQINTLFAGLTVLENLYLAVSERMGTAGAMFRPAGARPDVIAEAMRLIEMLKLGDDARTTIAELPYGRQRLVEIAIALALEPKVLLLDEPAAGVPSAESHILLDAVAGLPPEVAVLIIEHDMDVVFRFAHSITVLVNGSVLITGTPEEIGADAEVRSVYLGGAAHG
ncbi:MAG TPA: ABC transporter ATP-binding protein [Alphaproteobacteria bacterium]|nr:ABC transporter ATP-binding protein [Alphaproteobacteria bacterium]